LTPAPFSQECGCVGAAALEAVSEVLKNQSLLRLVLPTQPEFSDRLLAETMQLKRVLTTDGH
jgi:hypothetical protein